MACENSIEISIVTSMYKSAPYLKEFVALCTGVLERMNCENYEIIMVNDGSPDNSLAIALELKRLNQKIKILDLSRNFGHHAAFVAGMQMATGAYIFNIDCDLEVSPNILNDFYKIIKEQTNFDVVYGYQETRKGGFLEKVIGGTFWKLFNWIADTKIPPNVITERLMTRNYVKALLSLPDRNIFLAGLMYWIGFNQHGVAVAKGSRNGATTYTIKNRIRLMLEAISSFSAYPLRLLFKMGLVITSGSFLVGLFVVLRKLFRPDTIFMGYASVISVILFSTGIIVISIGLIGLYIEKIFNQVKDRPVYIIKQIY